MAVKLARPVAKLQSGDMLVPATSEGSTRAGRHVTSASLIERGALRPGDRLPAERDLAAQVGVSRPDRPRRASRAGRDGRRPVAARLGHLHSGRPAVARQPSR